jgi:hypothetical protein
MNSNNFVLGTKGLGKPSWKSLLMPSYFRLNKSSGAPRSLPSPHPVMQGVVPKTPPVSNSEVLDKLKKQI